MTICMFVYFAGIASCGMQGAEKMIQLSTRTGPNMCSAVLNSFGGGFIRDVFLLSVFPALFTPDCVPDIVVAMTAAFVYLNVQQCHLPHNTVRSFSVIADAAGLGTFIAIGVDKAMDLEAGMLTAILSGIITSQGGGVVAAVFCGKPLRQVLSTNVAYRLMAIGGVLLYSWWTGSTADRIFSQYAVILYTTIGALICNNVVAEQILKKLYSVIDSGILCSVMMRGKNQHFAFVPYYKRFYWNLKETKIAINHLIIACRKRTLLYQCMRLM